MRLFIALDLPDALKDRLSALKTTLPGATWVRRETYHLTLRFLGDDVPEARLPALKSALAALQHPAFDVQLAGVGRFPPSPKKAARVLWVGVAENPALQSLHRAVQEAVVVAGFPPEDAPLKAHITLARLKSEKLAPEIPAFLAHHAGFSAPPFRAESFQLYESRLTPQGAFYEVRGAWALGRTD
jgi:2'-5' RNA ligase